MTDLLSLIVRLWPRFARSARKLENPTCGNSFSKHGIIANIGGKSLSGIRLLGVSKIGHLSWVGCLNNEPVKIYQTFSPTHADYIERVSRDSVLGKYFPEVLHRDDKYLIVRWIHGLPLRARKVVKNQQILEDITSLQVTLHNFRLPTEVQPFDYLTFLQNRFLRYLGPFDQNESIHYIMDTLQQYKSIQLPACGSHPDITPGNLVIEKMTGRLKVVDNELLTTNWYFLIDLFNTYHSLGNSEDLANVYLKLYWKLGGDLAMLLEHRRFFLALWYLRLIGSTLQAGDIDKAFDLAKQLHLDHFMSHPLISLSERILK